MAKRDKAADVQAQLVSAALRLLVSEGPDAIQARRLAREISASTTAVYHYFGGMPALLRAVSDAGFRRLDSRLAAAGITDDPIADIARLGLAYRAAARENPHLYDMMFGLSAPGGHRPESGPRRGYDDSAGAHASPADAAYGHLVSAARRAVDAGRIQHGEPAHIAAQLWSMLHGFVSLELAGHLHRTPAMNDQILISLGINLLSGLTDDPDSISRSITPLEEPPGAPRTSAAPRTPRPDRPV